MRVYDVSITLGPDAPIWEDETGPVLETIADMAAGDHATVTRFSMGSHNGTHVDAPAHFVPGAATIEQLSPESLVGPAVVVEHTGPGDITAADLEALGVNGDHPRVLFKTANRRLWEDTSFRRDFVALAPSGAQRLIELGVRLVGIDYLSIEAYDAADHAVHRSLLQAGVVILEGVDLREVPAGEYLLVCAPLKLAGAEGAPARVFLVDGA
jgi:arylformamidase